MLSILPGLYAFLVIPVVDFILGEEEEPGATVPATAWYRPLSVGQRRDTITEHQLALVLMRDSTGIPKHLPQSEHPHAATVSRYRPLYSAVCYGFVALHVAVFTNATLVVAAAPASLPTLALTAFNVAVVGGFSFAVAHELVHGAKRADGVAAQVLLTLMCAKHWGLAHMAHHAQVATQGDPASARFHESVRRRAPVALRRRVPPLEYLPGCGATRRRGCDRSGALGSACGRG